MQHACSYHSDLRHRVLSHIGCAGGVAVESIRDTARHDLGERLLPLLGRVDLAAVGCLGQRRVGLDWKLIECCVYI